MSDTSLWADFKAGELAHFGKICALINAVFGGLSPVLLKKGMDAAGISESAGSFFAEFSSLFLNPYFIVGVLLVIFGTAIFMVGLSHGKASVLFALFGAGAQFFTFLGGWLILGENIFTVRKLVGASLVVVAIYLLGPSGEEGVDEEILTDGEEDEEEEDEEEEDEEEEDEE